MTIKVKQYKSEYKVGVKHQAQTVHGQFKIETGTVEYKIRQMLYSSNKNECEQ